MNDSRNKQPKQKTKQPTKEKSKNWTHDMISYPSYPIFLSLPSDFQLNDVIRRAIMEQDNKMGLSWFVMIQPGRYPSYQRLYSLGKSLPFLNLMGF